MTVSLRFLGAAGGVTGSRTLVETGSLRVLVDCGLFQGPKDIRIKNRQPMEIDGSKVDAVILTHAHLDHSGYLPRFCQEGFSGPIYCSEGTADLLAVMLADAAHLEEEQAKFANKSGYSTHKPAIPLFTAKDVEVCLKLLKPKARHDWNQIASTTSFRFIPAGHIIGASMVQFSFNENNVARLLTFSGDLGHDRMLTLRPPESLIETDTLVLESTYGDRLHPRDNMLEGFAEIIRRTHDRKGVLVIPAFAVGRAQEILFSIKTCEDRGLIPKMPVILDSPMSLAATRIFLNHPEEHKDGTISDLDGFLPENFSTSSTSDDSMLVCMKDGPSIVISAAGMLNGGRILHHLKVRLPRPENTILFCGYQAEGTKGRFLQENAKNLDTLRIHHEEVEVNAEIATISSLSAHGDWRDLTEWLLKMKRSPTLILLNHGDPGSLEQMRVKVQEALPKAKVQAITELKKVNL